MEAAIIFYEVISTIFYIKYLSSEIKVQLFKSLVRPIVLYGSEWLTMNRSDEDKLLTFERKILMRIFWGVGKKVFGEQCIISNYNQNLENQV